MLSYRPEYNIPDPSDISQKTFKMGATIFLVATAAQETSLSLRPFPSCVFKDIATLG